VGKEIARYDAVDAAEVSRRMRSSAGIDATVDEIIALYGEILAEYAGANAVDAEAEGRAAAAYLRWLTMHLRHERQALLNEHRALLDEVHNSTTSQLRKRIRRVPLLGALARSVVRQVTGPRSS